MSSRSARRCALVLAGVAAPLVLAPPAAAAQSTLTPETGGYFSRSGVADTGTQAGKPPNVTAGADGVSAGNLAVAANGGQEDKVSFLRFDLSALPEGTTVSKALLTVPLTEPDPPRDVNVNAAAERVQACAAGDQGFAGEDGESLTVAPDRLCDQFSAVATAADGGASYAFDITSLASGWVTGVNDGVALTVPEAERGTPVQVVFRPAAEATLALETSGGTVEVPAEEPADAGTGETAAGTGGTGSSGEVPFDGGFTGSSDLPAPSFEDIGLGAVEAPSVVALESLEAPATGAELPAAPEAAAPEVAPQPQQVVPVAFAREAPLNPTLGFWLGGLLLAGVLALLSLILGDPTVPQQTAAEQTRLARALAGQRRSSGLGRPAVA